MSDCDIFHNTGVGVCIAQGADPLIEKCRFFKGLSCGLLVQDGGKGVVRNSQLCCHFGAEVEVRTDGKPSLGELRVKRVCCCTSKASKASKAVRYAPAASRPWVSCRAMLFATHHFCVSFCTAVRVKRVMLLGTHRRPAVLRRASCRTMLLAYAGVCWRMLAYPDVC